MYLQLSMRRNLVCLLSLHLLGASIWSGIGNCFFQIYASVAIAITMVIDSNHGHRLSSPGSRHKDTTATFSLDFSNEGIYAGTTKTTLYRYAAKRSGGSREEDNTSTVMKGVLALPTTIAQVQHASIEIRGSESGKRCKWFGPTKRLNISNPASG